ncbi:UNVERIFIED_CONTAM: hypothetical protein Scaly_0302700 [Sesamum calycinum]|uniref:Cupin-like domain-containing protein n=1 Tax=Sesamum calycinum TaxID=2727403 RepID=A0AAW2SCM8_9LAMI
MEESLQIRRFELMPSAEEFASRIEPKNVPAVFSGCVKGWKAFSKWNVTSGGLDYLQPAFLEGKVLASVNLWMNNARSRSSTHYDPHHNLLCIISGCKQGQDRMLCMPSSTVDQKVMDAGAQSSNKNAGYSGQDLDLNHQTVSVKGNLEQGFSLHELEPDALRSLHELVSLVHDRVNWSQPVGNISRISLLVESNMKSRN